MSAISPTAATAAASPSRDEGAYVPARLVTLSHSIVSRPLSDRITSGRRGSYAGWPGSRLTFT